MYDTRTLGLPLVMPAQAQKHVTVNEAFARIDAAVQTRFSGTTLQSPPSIAEEGQTFLIPAGATGEWAGATGKIAIRSNGGWMYLTPLTGWTGWDSETASRLFFDGSDWSPEPQAFSKGGAATFSGMIEFDHEIVPGTQNVTSAIIPAYSLVIAITGRVGTTLEGNGLTSWRLGVEGSEDRYGSGIGLSVGSYALGLSGSPVAYYGDTTIKISSEGGEFLSGTIRICVHVISVRPPDHF